MKENRSKISRRSFVGTTSAVAAGLTIVPSSVVSGLGHTPPSDKLNVAGIGVGGMGNTNLRNIMKTENVVAVCDVDWGYSAKAFATYPDAKKYWDWRKM